LAVEVFANIPSTTVSSGGTDAPASGTQQTWTVASSTGFPAASSSATPPTQFHIADIALNSEIILVINVSGTTWTVIRGNEGTTPVSHGAGFTVFQVTTAGWLNTTVMQGELLFNVRDYGATGNTQRLRGITATSSSPVVTASGTTPAAAFTALDIGKQAVVYDGNNFAAGTFTTIASVQSATQVTLTANAGLTVSGGQAYLVYGTDDSAAIQNALNAASAFAEIDTGAGPNSPLGMGKPRVVVPATLAPGSGYAVVSQLNIPGGVKWDNDGMLFSFLSDRYAPFMIFNPYTHILNLEIDCLFGTGVQLGTNGGTNAAVHAERMILWHVGTSHEISGLLRSQDGIAMLGYDFPLGTVWMKGGRRGMYHNPGDDCIVAKAHLIGCLQGIYLNASNQVHYNKAILDTCGDTVSGNSGVILDAGCSMISFDVEVFEVTGSTKTLDNVVLIGNGSATKNTQVSGHITAQKTGGNVLSLQQAQDVEFTLLASNTASASSGGSNLTTAVVWGTVAGSCRIHAEMNGSITPYSGTPAGTYRYARGGVEYMVQAGAAPSAAAQAANGSGAPAPTVTGNDERGSVSLGSGTGPSAGSQVVLTFASATGWVTTTPFVTLTPLNSATAALEPYVAAAGNTTLTIGFAVAPAASQSAGTYQVTYRIEG
jgi:hypothetical protein